MKTLSIFLILIMIMLVPSAFGHPYTEKTDPLQGTNVSPGVTKVIIYYSEALEIDFSSLKVIDSDGNQIDNKDTKYFKGEESLIVTTPPLKDGVYTVLSKVLSKVDGHLVDYAFTFAVGEGVIPPELLESQGSSEIIFYPEAAARFPGLVGQTIVLGAAISSIFIWSKHRKDFLKENLEKLNYSFHGKFISLIGVGVITVFASNIVMLAVQSWRLQASAFDTLMTSSGTTWIIRMALTVGILGLWFILERRRISLKNQIPLLILSLALISTTTMMSHGAASELESAITLDYIHNFIAAVWIGGVIFLGFCLLPSLHVLEGKNKEVMSLSLIPVFSIMIVIALGILIITGPTLLWLLESDVSLISNSSYGKLIFAKIGIALVMVAFGGWYQFRFLKSGTADYKEGKIQVYKKLKRALKIESGLGVALLGVVALLANGTLPAGEISQVEAQEMVYGFKAEEYSNAVKFAIEIFPFSSGANNIIVGVTDLNGNKIEDLSGVKIKISNPERNISPIIITTNEIEDEESKFTGELSFGFSGKWQLQIEALRTQSVNEQVILPVFVKPKLNELNVEVIEYEFPLTATPLYPVFDTKDNLWISDPSTARLWKFNIASEEFSSFDFDGMTTITLSVDNDGKIWFTDTPNNKIGFFDPLTETFQSISLPEESIPISIQSDQVNDIWISVFDKNMILRYDQKNSSFEEFPIPTEGGGPFALKIDNEGNVWFTESASGKIGYLNPKNKEFKEFSPEIPIKTPEALYFDKTGGIWITAHTGSSLYKFDPILESFEKISVLDPQALPFGMSEDRYGNIWFAQHTVDKIAVYDPHNKNIKEYDVPTENSFVQFVTSDDNDNVWFVEQRGNKLGKIKLSERFSALPTQDTNQSSKIKYAEIVSPLISAGIIATSLFFVKTVKDKRKIDSLVNEI